MAYYRDISIIDIKDWELGLQDGFQFEDGSILPADATMIKERKKKLFKSLYPVVETDRGLQKVIKKSDKIATRLDGTRFVLTKEQVQAYYHHDSGMFEPDLQKHAEYEFAAKALGRAKRILARIEQRAKKIKDPSEIKDIEGIAKNGKKMCENTFYNLKRAGKDLINRIKESCQCQQD